MGQPARLKAVHHLRMGRTRGTETSQYPEEEKEMIDSLSSGDRKGRSLNRRRYGAVGVVGASIRHTTVNRNAPESAAAEGESPVRAACCMEVRHLSRAGHVKSCPNPRGPSRKAEYYRKTDSEPVP